MHTLTTHDHQAADIAIAFLRREVDRRRQLDRELDDTCLWAAINGDGQIIIGNPLLRDTSGFYVDYQGDVEFSDEPDSWSLDDFDDLLPTPDKT